MRPFAARHATAVALFTLLWACGGGGGDGGADGLVADAHDSLVPDDSSLVPGDVQDAGTDHSGEVDSRIDPGQPDGGGDEAGIPDAAEVNDASQDNPADAPDLFDPGPPPCSLDSDCDDGDLCTIDSCVLPAGKCVNEAVACDPGLGCFEGACDKGLCWYSGTVSDECFVAGPTLSDDFEQISLDDWTVMDLAQNQLPGMEVVWVHSTYRAHSGIGSLYFGDPEELDYDTGKVVASIAESGPVDAPAGKPLTLAFWVWADVEDGDLWDVLSVTLEATDGSIPVWTKHYGFPMKVWTPVAVDLTAFAGTTFSVAFTFNSVEHSFNDTEGIYVDDVMLLSKASAAGCVGDEDCDDGVPCTTDTCAAGQCAYDFSSGCCSIDLDCDDFDACTVDVCQDGACDHFPVANPLCCNTDWDCDDDNICTLDECSKNLCAHEVLDEPGCCLSVVDCDDSDECTQDKCQDNNCQHFNHCCFSNEECDDGDPICTDDSCVDGNCLYMPTGVEGCCAPEIAAFHFDDGGPGWTFTPSAGGVGWQVTSGGQTQSESKPGALYYGNPQTWNFNNGSINGGSATSPPFIMQPGYPATLHARVYMDSEGSSSYDKLWFKVLSDGLPTVTVWTKGYVSTKTFFDVTADLSGWAGRTVSVRLDFDTVDSLINGGLGVFVDDLVIKTPCAPKPCTGDSDCNDGIGATKDVCAGGICAWEF